MAEAKNEIDKTIAKSYQNTPATSVMDSAGEILDNLRNERTELLLELHKNRIAIDDLLLAVARSQDIEEESKEATE